MLPKMIVLRQKKGAEEWKFGKMKTDMQSGFKDNRSKKVFNTFKIYIDRETIPEPIDNNTVSTSLTSVLPLDTITILFLFISLHFHCKIVFVTYACVKRLMNLISKFKYFDIKEENNLKRCSRWWNIIHNLIKCEDKSRIKISKNYKYL